MKIKESIAKWIVGLFLFVCINVCVFLFQYYVMHIHIKVCFLFLILGVLIDGFVLDKILAFRRKKTTKYRNTYNAHKLLSRLDRPFSYPYPREKVRKLIVTALVADTWAMTTIGFSANALKLILAYLFASLFSIPDLTTSSGVQFLGIALIFIILGSRIMFIIVDALSKKLISWISEWKYYKIVTVVICGIRFF